MSAVDRPTADEVVVGRIAAWVRDGALTPSEGQEILRLPRAELLDLLDACDAQTVLRMARKEIA